MMKTKITHLFVKHLKQDASVNVAVSTAFHMCVVHNVYIQPRYTSWFAPRMYRLNLNKTPYVVCVCVATAYNNNNNNTCLRTFIFQILPVFLLVFDMNKKHGKKLCCMSAFHVFLLVGMSWTQTFVKYSSLTFFVEFCGMPISTIHIHGVHRIAFVPI